MRRTSHSIHPFPSHFVANLRFSRALLLGSLLALGACAATELPASTGSTNSATTQADWSSFDLGPNDLVYFSLFGHPDFRTPESGVRVAPDGTLSVALLGDVKVSGKSASEARQLIEAGLGEFYPDPSVSFSVIDYASRRFFVLGDVVEPGPVSMDRPLTALEGLSMGGGFAPGANRKQVVILRFHGGDDVEVISFNALTPGLDGMVQVRPDDMIFAGRSGAGVFTERVLPYIQGVGLSLGQTVSLALALDRL